MGPTGPAVFAHGATQCWEGGASPGEFSARAVSRGPWMRSTGTGNAFSLLLVGCVLEERRRHCLLSVPHTCCGERQVVPVRSIRRCVGACVVCAPLVSPCQ